MLWAQVRPLLAFQNRALGLSYLVSALLNAAFEVLAVGMVYPLIALASRPEGFKKQPWMEQLYIWSGQSDSQRLVLFLGCLFMATLVVTNLVNAATYWLHLRYTLSLRHRLSSHLLTVFLHRPYAWFVGRHTSDLARNVLEDVDCLVYQVVATLSTIVYRGVAALALLVGLVLINPWVALSSALLLLFCYHRIYAYFRTRLEGLGTQRMALNQQRHRLVQESLSSIKEGRLVHRRTHLHRDFEIASLGYTALESKQRLIGEMPRHITEVLAVCAICCAFLLIGWQSQDARQALPWIGLYIMATWRLVPALQEVYACLVDIRFSIPVLQALQEFWLEHPSSSPCGPSKSFQQSIALKGVDFTYPGGERPALQDVTLEIGKNNMVALVGHSGAGKTTTADLLGGLLRPSRGDLLVDGQTLEPSELESWPALIGYVPQTIYLSDDTVARNIAMGYPDSEIDLSAVVRAARLAHIDEFVDRLPQGYQTRVGERGLSLSGGERQRIGIARALYHQPEILVLDEATSALDNPTETSVMGAIQELAGGRTIIVIAHRLTTIRECNPIFVFDQGRLVEHGTYSELWERCPVFQALVGQAPKDENPPLE